MWWLLVPGALAAQPDAHVREELSAALAASGGDVIVCGAGAEAERVARAIVDEVDPRVAVRRVATAADPAAEGRVAIDTAGVRCALVVTEGAAGAWKVVRVGLCGASPDPATDRPDRERAREEFERRRLTLEAHSPLPGEPDPVRWSARDRSGRTAGARDLAQVLGDEETLALLDRESARARRDSRIVRWTGTGVLVLSPSPLLGVEYGRPESNEDRLWTSAFLLASGAALVAVAPAIPRATRARQAAPAHYYESSSAPEVVEAWNAALALSLGLPAGPAEAAPVAPPAEAPPAPAEPPTGDDGRPPSAP